MAQEANELEKATEEFDAEKETTEPSPHTPHSHSHGSSFSYKKRLADAKEKLAQLNMQIAELKTENAFLRLSRDVGKSTETVASSSNPEVERVRAALNKRIFELEASLQKERFVHSSGASAHEQELEGYKNQIASLTTENKLLEARLETSRSARADSGLQAITKLRIDMKEAQEKEAQLQQEIENRNIELANRDASITELTSQLNSSRALLSSTETALTRARLFRESGASEQLITVQLQKKEIDRLNKMIISLQADLEKTQESTSQITYIETDNSEYKAQIALLTQELKTLRILMGEKDLSISKLRIEVRDLSAKLQKVVISNESEQLAQQLKTAKVEARVAREEADRARREVLISTSSHFELSKQRDEVLRLTRLVDSLKLELDMTNKRNAEMSFTRQESASVQLRSDDLNSLRATISERDATITKLRGEIFLASLNVSTELKVKSQSEEIASLRKTLAERDLTISSLRFQFQENSTRVINIKDSVDYRALQQQFSVVIEQLNAARAETSTLREQADASQKSRQEVLLVRDQTDAGSTALLRFEVDFQKREVLRLMQALEDLHREREASRKDSVQLLTARQETESLQNHIQSLTLEITSLRALLTEKESQIAKLRTEVQQSTVKVYNVKESQEYLTMTSQLDLHVRMLEEERKESARLRDEQEKLRLEFISARAESDKVTRESFELQLAQKAQEVISARQTIVQLQDSVVRLRVELEESKIRVFNVKDSEDYRILQKSYEAILLQIDGERRENTRLRELTDKLRSDVMLSVRENDNSIRENYEKRLKILGDDLVAIFQILKEREILISNLRTDINYSPSKSENVKESHEFLIVNKSLQFTTEQLEMSKRELERLNILIEQLRSENQSIRKELEKVHCECDETRTTATTQRELLIVQGPSQDLTEITQLRKELATRDSRVEFVESNMACMRKELISKDDLIARLRTEVRAASSGRSRVALSVIDPDSAEPSAETAAALQRELATSRAQIDTLTAKCARVSVECKKYETRVSELESTVQSLRTGVRAGEEQVSATSSVEVVVSRSETRAADDVARLQATIESLRGELSSSQEKLEEANNKTVLALREVTEHVHRVSQLEAIVHLQGEQLTSNDTLVASLRDEIAVLSQRSPRPHTLDSAEAAAAQDSFGEAQQPQPQPQPQQQQQQQKTELQQQQEQQLHQEIKRLTDTLEKLRGELSASKAELEGINNKYQLITNGTNIFEERKYLRELEGIVQRQRTDLESNEELIANLRSQVQEPLPSGSSAEVVSIREELERAVCETRMAQEQSSVYEKRIEELETELTALRAEYESLQAAHSKCGSRLDDSDDGSVLELQQQQPIEQESLVQKEAMKDVEKEEMIVEKMNEETSEKADTKAAAPVVAETQVLTEVAESVEAESGRNGEEEEESAKSSSHEISFKLTPEQLAEMFGLAFPESEAQVEEGGTEPKTAEAAPATTTTTTTTNSIPSTTTTIMMGEAGQECAGVEADLKANAVHVQTKSGENGPPD